MELEHMEERTERQTANSEHRVANIGNKQRQTMASSDCGLSPNATWRRPSHVSVGSWRLLLLLWHGGCHLLAENSTLAFLIQTHIRRSTCIRIGEWGARTRGKCHSLNWKNNARIWPTASKVDDDGHDDGNDANIYRHHTKMSKAMGLSTRGLKFNYSVTRAPVAVN